MRITYLVVMALCSSACNAKTQYKDAAEFEAVVRSWQLVGKSESEAFSFLTKRNYLCKEHYCFKEVRGLVCNQKLKVNFVLSNDEKIINTSIWKLADGRLPSVCL